MAKKILILGGARFHGLQLVNHFYNKGECVSVLNRGKHKKDYPVGIEHIIADRNFPEQIEKSIGTKKFDIVIDNNGYNPKQILNFLGLIKDKCEHYIFTSSIAVYLKQTSERRLKEGEANGIQTEFFFPQVKKYAVEKFYSEEAIRNFNNLNYTILRFPNIFGEDFLGKLFFFYEKLKNGEKITLEKEIKSFNLIYFQDVVKAFEKIVGNKNCFGNTINIADSEEHNYDEFFSKIYDNYSSERKRLLPGAEIAKQENNFLFPWGPLMDTSLFKRLINKIDYTPVEEWGKKTLEWEIKNFEKKK